jgi:hypothetical protein
MVASTDLFPGQWQPQVVLMAALQVGLIGALLDQPRAPSEVAQELALDHRAAVRVISVLVDACYLEKRSDGVVVSPDTRSCQEPTGASSPAGAVFSVVGGGTCFPRVNEASAPAKASPAPVTMASRYPCV